MGLEDLLYGSKTIRNFLHLFSEQYWNRVSKATIMLGIQYLSQVTNNDLHKLSIQDIEDIVVNLAAEKGRPKNDEKKHKKDKHAKKDKKKHHHHNRRQETTDKSLADSSAFLHSQTSEQESRRSSPPKKRHSDRQAPKNKVAEKINSIESTLTQTQQVPTRGKPPSNWRDNSKPRTGRFDNIEETKPDKRSNSLNPQIYPSWWGEDSDFEHAIQRDKSSDAIKRRRGPGKNDKEDSLDQRLKQAEKNKHKHAQKDGMSPVNPTTTYYHQQTHNSNRQDASPNYAFTSNKNAPKYSPLRQPNPGANNIPMSYTGPPSQAEINRNKGRNHHNNAYATGYSSNQQRTYEDQPIPNGGGGGGGFSRGGGMALSYTPPRNKSNANSKKTLKPVQKQPQYQPPKPKQQNFVNERKAYQPEKQASTAKFKNVESRIKHQIIAHKRDFEYKKQRQGYNTGKEIEIKYKENQINPYQRNGNDGLQTGLNSSGAALRRRNSPLKEQELKKGKQPQQQQYQLQESDNQTDHYSMRNTQGQWPSSIENLNMSNNRSTGQNFYNQQQQQLHHQRYPTRPVGFDNPDRNVGEITQGLINSPIRSNYTESSPEGKASNRFGNPKSYQIPGGHQGIAANEPSILRPQNQTRFGGPHNYNDETNDQVLFRSDGFEQSRFYNQTHQNVKDQSKYYQPQQQLSGEISNDGPSSYTNRMLVETSQGNITNYARQSNPFARNQLNQNNSSYIQGTYSNEYRNLENNVPSGRQQKAPKANEWIGEYTMGKDNESKRDRNINDLAESNRYTYTLQQPLTQQQRNTHSNFYPADKTHIQSVDEEDSESQLSEYSPPQEAVDYYQNNLRGGESGGSSKQNPYSIQNQTYNYYPQVQNQNFSGYGQPSMLQGEDLSGGSRGRPQGNYNFNNGTYGGQNPSSNRRGLMINENNSRGQEEDDDDDDEFSDSGEDNDSQDSYTGEEDVDQQSHSSASSSAYSSQQKGIHPATAGSQFYQAPPYRQTSAAYQGNINQTHHY